MKTKDQPTIESLRLTERAFQLDQWKFPFEPIKYGEWEIHGNSHEMYITVQIPGTPVENTVRFGCEFKRGSAFLVGCDCVFRAGEPFGDHS